MVGLKSSVLGGTTRTRRELEAYLYDHTTIESFEETDRGIKAVIVTVADTASRCEFLAQYQRDRLASGLWGAAPLPR